MFKPMTDVVPTRIEFEFHHSSHVTKSIIHKYLHSEASGSWKYIRAGNVLPVILYACCRLDEKLTFSPPSTMQKNMSKSHTKVQGHIVEPRIYSTDLHNSVLKE